jgi:hypothetical protein
MAQDSKTYVATVVRDDFFNDPFFKGDFHKVVLLIREGKTTSHLLRK